MNQRQKNKFHKAIKGSKRTINGTIQSMVRFGVIVIKQEMKVR